MIYAYEITIPAGTLSSLPQLTKAVLDYGVIHQLDIDIPPGCQGEIGVRFRRGQSQVFPSNPNGYFTGDSVRISMKENYALLEEPYALDILTFNDDTVNNHTIMVRLGLLRAYLGQKLVGWGELFEL